MPCRRLKASAVGSRRISSRCRDAKIRVLSPQVCRPQPKQQALPRRARAHTRRRDLDRRGCRRRRLRCRHGARARHTTGGGASGRLVFDQREHVPQAFHAEELRRLLGRAGIDHVAARADEHERVAHVDVGDRVGRQDDGATLVGEKPEQEHHPLVEPRVEARRRLVEEEDLRLDQELGRDRHALALPTAQRLHELSPLVLEVDERERAIDARLALLLRHVLAEADARLEPQRLLDAQVSVHDVVLGHEAHEGAVGAPALVEAHRVVGDVARDRSGLSREQAHQGALAGAARSGHRREACRLERQVHVREEGLRVVLTRPPLDDLHARTNRVHPHAADLGEGLEGLGPDDRRERPDLDEVARRNPRAACHPRAVDVGPCHRCLVLDEEAAVSLSSHDGVSGSDQRVGESDRRRRGRPDHDGLACRRQRAAQPTGLGHPSLH